MLIEVAGVPCEVRCSYEQEERAFLQDYLTNKEPLFTIEPTKEDLLKIQQDFDRMAEAVGARKVQYGEPFLENNAIHALLAEKLVEHNVLLMHGSALCMDGEAYVFTAPSGTGKSTHARLWGGVFADRVWVINDDKPMLRIEDDHVLVYGTPWDGKHRLSRNACAPLKAIANLERSETNHIEPISKSEAFCVLLKQAYVSESPETMKSITSMDRVLVEMIPFYRLCCNMEPEAALVAWRGMNEGSIPLRVAG